MNYWLHRISHEAPVSHHLFFNEGYLTIGWHCYMGPDLLEEVRQNDKNGFEKFMNEVGNTSRGRWSLYNFFNFKKGDTVVVPLWEGKAAICVVEEEAVPLSQITLSSKHDWTGETVELTTDGLINKVTGESYDLGFAVKVKILGEAKPRTFADASLIARMKIRITTAFITDLKESVEKFKISGAPPSLYEELYEKLSGNIVAAIMGQVNPDKFEKLVKWYMKKMGADSVEILAKNERGKENGADADVAAIFNDLKIIFYIQAKQHWGTTDDWAVHQISEYKGQKEMDAESTHISWVISLADEFSVKAQELAAEKSVRLINGSEFAKMLMHVGFQNIDDAFK